MLLLLPFLTFACGSRSEAVISSVYIVDQGEGVIIDRFSGDEESLWGPSLSPDGEKLAFSKFVWGADVVEIYLMDIDGSNLRQLTKNGRNNYPPSWSPDGEVVTFVSQDADDTDSAEIYAIHSDGTNEVPLTDNSAYEYGSSWSPDGRFVVFGTERGGSWQIFLMNPDGSNQRPLEIPAHGNAPAISPDGQRIVFTSDREGNDDVWIMNVDGSNQLNLTSNTAWDDQAHWSPDGSMIAFTSDRQGPPAIYLMNADGSGVRPLLEHGFADMAFASWLPSGVQLLFHGTETRE